MLFRSPYLSDSVKVAVLPVRPTGRHRWQTVLAVQATEASDDRVQVRADIRRGNSKWVRQSEARLAPFSVSKPYRLRSGDYVAAATVSYLGETEPRAATTRIELPTLEGDGWLLVEPIILRSLGAGRVDPETLEGTELEGDPLLGRVPVLLHALVGDALFASTHLCRYGVSATADKVTTTVEVAAASGPIFSASTRLTFTRDNGLHCRAVDHALPELAAGRYQVTVKTRPPASAEIVKQVSLVLIAGPQEPEQATTDY